MQCQSRDRLDRSFDVSTLNLLVLTAGLKRLGLFASGNDGKVALAIDHGRGAIATPESSSHTSAPTSFGLRVSFDEGVDPRPIEFWCLVAWDLEVSGVANLSLPTQVSLGEGYIGGGSLNHPFGEVGFNRWGKSCLGHFDVVRLINFVRQSNWVRQETRDGLVGMILSRLGIRALDSSKISRLIQAGDTAELAYKQATELTTLGRVN